ncbi:hypothetical protein FN846DRAFT_777390 [Sphaerosporella brunnea]|uniref:Ubiquitin carboxyl-terminal hydrolase 19 n=1 Tax=Sphaerosporella brunnea TaxID=1250544 RepID=A0A5J5EZA4_9PEZI|nr:hypothetical protein FN846DRAFT_777390 [Sphaerosporella brunnea]
MEPQFAGVYDPWGLQEEIRLLKVAQFEHAERLSQHSERISKLEKRHDDSRIRSLWSSASPFPAPLSTFSQQPTNTGPETLDGYDHQQNLVLSGLQLDEVDVPRRGASRANSVRFDDSATTNHWIHDSPGTSEYFQVGQRPGNSIGGYAMTERSSSHKSDNRSDGRQSLRSFGGDVFLPYEGDTAILRPQTQCSDTLDPCTHRPSMPKLGPSPAVIRCWLDVASSFEPLLYAVICTGSARSAIEMSLVIHLGLQDRITRTSEGDMLEVPVYLPDAIVQHHSRITGPSKLPRLTAEFLVLPVPQPKSRAEETIRIFIGSDVLASHMGDLLFSQSKVFLHVEDGRKVFVPFIRPDAEGSFSDIFTAHSRHFAPTPRDRGLDNGSNGGKSVDPAVATTDSRMTQLSVSSPRPIYGSHASVIRGVAAMEPEFSTKEHSHVPTATSQQSDSTYHGMGSSRPWTASADSRKPSFGGESPNDLSPRPDTSHSPFEGKTEGDAVTRGRSLTNPYEESAVVVSNSQQGMRVWDGARKTSMTYAAPLKESNAAGTVSAVGSYSRGSSRGMKVLRTSKSFSSSTEKVNNQANSSGESSTPANLARNNTSLKPAANRGHNRTMSGGGAIHPPQNPKEPLVRTKSSNVVGGATAFHWMTPKSVGDE